jgi:hypothetical protein
LVSVTAVAAQVDVNKGKGMGAPIAAGALVQDESSELVSRKQEVIP